MQKKASGPHPAEHPNTIITIMTDRRRTSGNDTAIINDHGINNDMTSTDDNDSQRISDYQIHPEQSHNSPSFVSQNSPQNFSEGPPQHRPAVHTVCAKSKLRNNFLLTYLYAAEGAFE